MHHFFTELEDSPQFDKTVRGVVVQVGRADEKEPFSALYISEDMAAHNLLGSILSNIEGKKWNWFKKPVIEKFAMTECPLGQATHRTVVPRYAGYCEIEIGYCEIEVLV
jgi:hypothetical protein